MSESIKRYVKWYKSRINNEVAQRYLDKLGINNQDAIEKFEIAYCDGSYLKHIKRQSSSPLSFKNFKQSFAADGLLDGSHQEKFRSGLIFRLYGDDNSLKQVWVSKVSERLKSGRYELLLNDCIDVLWNQEALKVREVILTNGILDGLSCWVNGYHNVSSVLHINTFNDWLVGRLLESNVKQVVLALSYSDLKSDQVTKFIGKLVSSGFVVLKVQLPRTMTLQRYAMKKDLGDLFDSVVAVQGIVSLSHSTTNKSICKTTHESTCSSTSP